MGVELTVHVLSADFDAVLAEERPVVVDDLRRPTLASGMLGTRLAMERG
jgi:hypothetical protein